jgi:hypothetical protein
MKVITATSSRKKIVVTNSAGFSVCVVTPSVVSATVGRHVTIVANQGITGPPGQDGADAPGATVIYPAGENLSSGRVVIINSGSAFYFQPSNALHAGRAYAVTKTSGLTGANVTLQLVGEVSDPAFTFLSDSGLWVSANGQVTSTKPTSGLIQYAGVSVALNKFRIEFLSTIQA